MSRANADMARDWLRSMGWQIDGKRAVRGTVSIPAPKEGSPYDVHDIADELGVSDVDITTALRVFLADRRHREGTS